MEQKSNYVLDAQDKKIVDLFTDMGMPKNLAKILLYVSQVDECYSKDIERGADLRQPEVSVTMQELRRRRWVKKRSQNKKGKGRPVHIYKSAKDLVAIVKDIEQQKMGEIEGIKKNVSELKNMVTARTYEILQ